MLVLTVTAFPTLAPLGERDPQLFFLVSIGYALFALVSTASIHHRFPGYRAQLYTQILIDIAAIILLMYASGGVRSGLGMLLIVTLASGGMLMSGQIAVLFAAIATLTTLGAETYPALRNMTGEPAYTHAGLLGVTYFITAVVAHLLAKRARDSEALAAQRGVDLANMQQLTEYVIQRMQTGIIVIDSARKIRLINESAWHALGTPTHPIGQTITDLAPALAAHYFAWQENPAREPRILRLSAASPEILPRFAALGQAGNSGTLMFLEDTSAMAQQAQQMKLASLGRLTASIAHEIRNPLGAISHAGQLLAESPHLHEGDVRLTEIIRDHSQRMNAIVENILQLSRRQRARPEDLELKSWLEDFIADFCTTERIDAKNIGLHIDPPHTQVRIDTSQLHQILWNLCHNGIRYSRAHSDAPRLELRGGAAPESPSPFLDIIDFGPGIATEHVEQLFEPFFTTETQGTGLGLYISRELCESNQARLHYLPVPNGGSCFRITFADPRRKQVT